MLPDDGYQPPPRLLVDAERRLVRFTTEDGRTTKDFDFARLRVDPDLQAAFARAFDHLTGPSGTRKRLWTAAKSFEVRAGSPSTWRGCPDHHRPRPSWPPPTWTATP
jgi:hypothetical protein